MQNQWLQKSLGMFDGVLKISINTLNSSQVSVGNLNNKKTHHRTRLNPNIAIKVSSVALQNEASGDLPEPNQISGSFSARKRCQFPKILLNESNSVGIIGGVSVLSTLIFLEKFVWWSSRNGGDSIPFLVCSDPAINRQLPNHISPNNGKVEIHLNHHMIIENLRWKRKFLEQSGAGCIIMPCHVSNVWHQEISEDCSVQFLNVGDCVARELKEAKFKPLEAGRKVRIGVLAKDSTLMANFYQRKLQNQGFEVVLLDKPSNDHTVLPALEALKKKDMEGARNLLRIAIQVLLVRAVNIVILAADEFRYVLPLDDPLLKKCIDPMDALARSAINWARAKEKVY